MWKLTTVLTTLVLGTSAVAMAQTGGAPLDRDRGYQRTDQVARGDVQTWYRDDDWEWNRDRDREDRYESEDRDEPEYRDEGYDRDWRYRFGARDDFGPRRYRHAWVALSAPRHLDDGDREVIRVDDPYTFTQLRLQTMNGASYIDRVVVVFLDGTRQVARVQRWLDPRRPRVEIPLRGNNRRLDRIVVIGDSYRRGVIQVFAI